MKNNISSSHTSASIKFASIKDKSKECTQGPTELNLDTNINNHTEKDHKKIAVLILLQHFSLEHYTGNIFFREHCLRKECSMVP